MEAGEYGLAGGTSFIARHLEVVAIAGLLWISWGVSRVVGLLSFFLHFYVERTRLDACLLYTSDAADE